MLAAASFALAAAPNASALGAGGIKGNDDSYRPSISADGRYVAFGSRAINLGAGDLDAIADVYVRDLDTGATTLVSRATGAGGVKGNGPSFSPRLSADGRYVVFTSEGQQPQPSRGPRRAAGRVCA